ncbi:hypothetical protein BU16DRAFT_617669 [Lophium mytilinum]|uniref:Uncharacterized protein n=1 Tax=Lophium mytilinum TaxID=390894 RepID=A0A6A6QUV1_9PEZI|nr:hypothetical protein BU16DRAFT_617669 [Lophium mytilinum]
MDLDSGCRGIVGDGINTIRPIPPWDSLVWPEVLRTGFKNEKPNRGDEILWDTIKQCCRGLVQEDASNRVDFLHHSLREYLNREDGLKKIPRQNEEPGKRCIAYLGLKSCTGGVCLDPGSLEERRVKWPLLDYATRYWTQHFILFEKTKSRQIANEEYMNGSFHALAFDFLRYDDQVESSFQINMFQDPGLRFMFRMFPNEPETASEILHEADIPGKSLEKSNITSAAGLFPERMRELHRKLFYASAANRTTGLHITCASGFRTLVQKLLAVRPDLLNRQDFFQMSPLHIAA